MRRLLFCAFIILTGTANAAPAPIAPHNQFVPGITFRLFKDQSQFTLFGELSALEKSDQEQHSNLMAGSYYQFSSHWSGGVFYRRDSGLRHNDDWVKENGKWRWHDANSRGEDILVLDATYRTQIENLLGPNWVAELKARYLNNYFNNEHTLFLRPGFTYFWLKDGQAFMNFFVQFEFDKPLNFNSEKINERWTYGGALYRLGSKWDVGGFYARRWREWSSSKTYLATGSKPYAVASRDDVLMALLLWHF